MNYTGELGPHAQTDSYLGDESDQLSKMRGLFARIDLKYLTRGLVMVPLL